MSKMDNVSKQDEFAFVPSENTSDNAFYQDGKNASDPKNLKYKSGNFLKALKTAI